LTFDKPIVDKIYLKGSNGKVKGTLVVKVYWDDVAIQDRDFMEFNRVSSG
jgi:hypothetical protein